MMSWTDKATQVVELASQLGAQQASATVSRGSHITLMRRNGRIEQATEATTQGLSVSLLVDDRYSSHQSSDLRPEAVRAFLERAIEATRYLEQDPDRRLPDVGLCGRGASPETLDQDDPTHREQTAESRAERSKLLDQALESLRPPNLISQSSYIADGMSEITRVLSNGFSATHREAWFAPGGDATLREDGGKRPEADVYYAARHLADLPSADEVTTDLYQRVTDRLGSHSVASGAYPLILANRAAGRLLGMFGAPLSGNALFEDRSCLAKHLGKAIGSSLLTLVDNPTLPRGLGSRPWDADALVATPRTIIDKGVLKSYYIDVYYGRKLHRPPTTGGPSNWVIPPGTESWQRVAAGLPKAIWVTGFLGGNANPITGDFSFGIRGTLLENGQPTQSLSEMNISGNLLQFFHRLVAVGDDPWAYAALRSPTLVFENVQFSGT